MYSLRKIVKSFLLGGLGSISLFSGLCDHPFGVAIKPWSEVCWVSWYVESGEGTLRLKQAWVEAKIPVCLVNQLSLYPEKCQRAASGESCNVVYRKAAWVQGQVAPRRPVMSGACLIWYHQQWGYLFVSWWLHGCGSHDKNRPNLRRYFLWFLTIKTVRVFQNSATRVIVNGCPGMEVFHSLQGTCWVVTAGKVFKVIDDSQVPMEHAASHHKPRSEGQQKGSEDSPGWVTEVSSQERKPKARRDSVYQTRTHQKVSMKCICCRQECSSQIPRDRLAPLRDNGAL